MQFWSKISIC